MICLTQVLLLCVFARQAFGTVHHMFSGVFGGSDLYAVEFDDEVLSLTIANTIATGGSSSKWIAIDERKQNIYVGNGAQYDSYAITNDTNLEYMASVNITGNCSNANFIVASTASPYVVFGAPYNGGCPGQMITVDSTGTLSAVIANVTYGNNSGVHGMALSADNQFVYSADDMGNAVWAHSINTTTGEVAEIQYIASPTGANPRHLVVHPKGTYAYVVFEELNQIGVFTRNTTSGELAYTNTTYPMIPPSFTNISSYWSDEVLFSHSISGSPSYMYASTRSRTTSLPGYVTAFSIDAETGSIIDQLFITPTTGSGGSANAVSPAIFSEEHFVITDSSSNFIEIWAMAPNITGGVAASVVAHLDIATGPANAVWYD